MLLCIQWLLSCTHSGAHVEHDADSLTFSHLDKELGIQMDGDVGINEGDVAHTRCSHEWLTAGWP